MRVFALGNKVKINPTVVEDEATKINHHLFGEALKHNVTGEVVELDAKRSTAAEFWYGVKFHFFTPPLKEHQIVLLSKE